MKKILVCLALLTPLAACTQEEQGAVVGAGAGGLIGAAVASPGNTAEGALVGAAVGGVAGALIGRNQDRQGYCEYRGRYGRTYTARCPRGYRY